MSPEATYRAICDAPDTEQALRRINQFQLSRLITWLRTGHRSGIQAVILGMAELEAADQFVKAHP
jgi:hypothetical protein